MRRRISSVVYNDRVCILSGLEMTVDTDGHDTTSVYS